MLKMRALPIYASLFEDYLFNLKLLEKETFRKDEMADQAIDHFQQLQQHDEVILILLLNACARLKPEEVFSLVKKVSLLSSKSLHSSLRLLPSLIDDMW